MSHVSPEDHVPDNSGKKARHLESYGADSIERKDVDCPTNSMAADVMTQAITGSKFSKAKRMIMNID
jgi:hypothetical protein